MSHSALPPLTKGQRLTAIGFCFIPHAILALLLATSVISEKLFFGIPLGLNLTYLVIIGAVAYVYFWCIPLEGFIKKLTRSPQWDSTMLGCALGVGLMIIPACALLLGSFVGFAELFITQTRFNTLYAFVTERSTASAQMLLGLNFVISMAGIIPIAFSLLNDQRKHNAELVREQASAEQRQHTASQEPRCAIRIGMYLARSDGTPIDTRKSLKLYDELRAMPDGTFVGRIGDERILIGVDGQRIGYVQEQEETTGTDSQ